MHADLECLLWGVWLFLPGIALAQVQPDAVYAFSTEKYRIEMRVHFPMPYEGKPLLLYNSANPGTPFCPTMEGSATGCAKGFVGAIAAVTFRATRMANGKPAEGSIREVVTVLEQSAVLPPRPPSQMVVRLIHGFASDTQAFGYDESPLPVAERAAERKAAKAAWRRYRQELYINGDKQPFAVVQWLHTTARIRIERVDSPALPPGGKR